jgi:hypothetical protein
MTRWIHHVEVERVVVRGAGVDRLDGNELRTLIERAVARELGDAALPKGRTMRAAVQITARSVAKGGAAGVAAAVASGVASAATGGPGRG